MGDVVEFKPKAKVVNCVVQDRFLDIDPADLKYFPVNIIGELTELTESTELLRKINAYHAAVYREMRENPTYFVFLLAVGSCVVA